MLKSEHPNMFTFAFFVVIKQQRVKIRKTYQEIPSNKTLHQFLWTHIYFIILFLIITCSTYFIVIIEFEIVITPSVMSQLRCNCCSAMSVITKWSFGFANLTIPNNLLKHWVFQVFIYLAFLLTQWKLIELFHKSLYYYIQLVVSDL